MKILSCLHNYDKFSSFWYYVSHTALENVDISLGSNLVCRQFLLFIMPGSVVLNSIQTDFSHYRLIPAKSHTIIFTPEW